MDFPPVSNLVNATFDQLNNKPDPNAAKTPPQAPQPVANSEGIDGGQGHGHSTAAIEGSQSVGGVLNVTA